MCVRNIVYEAQLKTGVVCLFESEPTRFVVSFRKYGHDTPEWKDVKKSLTAAHKAYKQAIVQHV